MTNGVVLSLCGHVSPVPKTWTPGCYTDTVSQCVSIYFPGDRVETRRSIDSASSVGTQSPIWTTPDQHCQWDLMLVFFLPSQPKQGPCFTANYAGAMGIK